MLFSTFAKFAVAAVHVGGTFANPTSLEARQSVCVPEVCSMDANCTQPACPDCLMIPNILGIISLPGVCVPESIGALVDCVLDPTQLCRNDSDCPDTCTAIPGVSVSYFCYTPIGLLGPLGLGVCIPQTP